VGFKRGFGLDSYFFSAVPDISF